MACSTFRRMRAQHVCGFAEPSVGIAVVSGAAEDDRSAVGYLAEHEACGYGEPAGLGARIAGVDPVLRSTFPVAGPSNRPMIRPEGEKSDTVSPFAPQRRSSGVLT